MVRAINRRSNFKAAILGDVFGLLLLSGLVLISPAQALDVTLENITVRSGDRESLHLARVDVTGTNLTQEELANLFSSDTTPEIRRSLVANLRAEKIAIPEAVLVVGDAKLTLSNVFATAIANGKVGSAGLTGIDGTVEARTYRVKSGPLALEGADLSEILGLGSRSFSVSRFTWDAISVRAISRDTPSDGDFDFLEVGSVSVEASFDGDIPLKTVASVKGLSFRAPPASDLAALLAAIGYEKPELGLTFVSTYDPAARTFTLADFTISGVNAGSLTLKARLGAIDKAALTGSEPERRAALFRGNIAAAELGYSDRGPVKNIMAYCAKQQQKSPATLQAEAGAMARQLVPVLLGGAPNALMAADAVSRFIASPTALAITFRPKAGEIGYAELMQLTNPPAFIDRIDVDVRTGG
jgi:hypothetical protein